MHRVHVLLLVLASPLAITAQSTKLQLVKGTKKPAFGSVAPRPSSLEQKLCQVPNPEDDEALSAAASTTVPLESIFIRTARRASAVYLSSVAPRVKYRPMGVFFSEALAIIAAVEAVGATHLIESGTAEGQSTELLARYFGERLNITTIDRDTLYHLYEQTKARLSKFPSVTCMKGDSFEEIPRLLASMPHAARVVVFVDGPKGKLGLQLVRQALKQPKVALVAFHDTAQVWDAALHNEMMADPEGILMTSEGRFRSVFGAIDSQHGEAAVLQEAYRQHPTWKTSKIPHILAKGNGLWLAGKSRLLSGPLFDDTVHVAMSASDNQLSALLTAISAIIHGTIAPGSLAFHLFTVGEAALAQTRQAVSCMIRSGLALSATITVHAVDTTAFHLLKGRSAGAVSNLVRFYLPDLLPKVDKVLWIDVDGLVRGDVRTLASGLFTGEHETSPIAAVRRFAAKSLTGSTGIGMKELGRLGLTRVRPNSTVFNAGFMAFNLREWRKQGVIGRLERLVDALAKLGFQGFPGISTKDDVGAGGKVHDSQTPLVLLFNNVSGSVIQWIPARWNVDGLGWRKDVQQERLCAGEYLHWSGKHKPWHVGEGDRSVILRDLWVQHEAKVSRCVTHLTGTGRSSRQSRARQMSSISAKHHTTSVKDSRCWMPAEDADSVWGHCEYTIPSLSCPRGCGQNGVCFFGRCMCAPGATSSNGGACGERTPIRCKPLNTLYPKGGSPEYNADRCLVNSEYGAAVIPAKRWQQAQSAEARLWATGHDGNQNSQSGDRAAEHVAYFDNYRSLPSQLGDVAEIGAGPWTQTYFALSARPDVHIKSLTVIDPGIPGYLSRGVSSYQNGTMLPPGWRGRPIPVHKLPMGAEQVPKRYTESFDTVVMINCVEHTFNAFATLYSAHRILRPGGLFIFHERSVRLSSGAQMYHPVRLNTRFLQWYEDTLFERSFEPTQPFKLKHFVESLTYFIGRKKHL